MTDKPSIRERLRLAAKVYRDGLPWQRWGGKPEGRKQAPFSFWPLWKQDQTQYTMNGVQSYIDEGFNMNALIYAAIMYKAKSMAQAPARAYGGERSSPVLLDDNHPLSKLCHRPNPNQSWSEFIQMQSIFLNLCGEAFTFVNRKNGVAGVPSELWPMNPLHVGITPLAKNQVGYTYLQNGITTPLLAQDVSHVKFPNPSDELGGMGHGLPPLMAAARSGDVDNTITDFIYNFFKSGTMMNTYITFDTPMDPDVMAQTRDKYMEIYGGAGNWVKPGVFDSGGKIVRVGMNFDEMGFAELDGRNETRVLMVFGQGLAILIGAKFGLMYSKYSNYGEARKSFWQDTMLNEITMFQDDLQYYINADDGGFIAFDTSGIEELQPNKVALSQSYVSLVTSGAMTKEQAAQWLGIDLPESEPEPVTPETETEPTTPPPASDDAESTDDSTTDERGEGGSKAGHPFDTGKARTVFTNEQKAAHWKAVDATARKWEPQFTDASRKVFNTQLRGLLAVLAKAKAKAQRRKATVDWEAVEKEALDYMEEAGEEWQAAFIPLVRGVVIDQGKRWAAELGIAFDVQNLPSRDWFNQYVLKFAQEVSATTNDAIRQIMARAQAEGSSIPDIQKQLDETFNRWMYDAMPDDPDWEWFTDRLPAYRTEMIARTETIRSSNAGTTELFGEWGVEKKEWLSTMDDRTRPEHAEVNGQVVGINEPFIVGGEELMFPGDPSASPELTISCRCTVLPVME